MEEAQPKLEAWQVIMGIDVPAHMRAIQAFARDAEDEAWSLTASHHRLPRIDADMITFEPVTSASESTVPREEDWVEFARPTSASGTGAMRTARRSSSAPASSSSGWYRLVPSEAS